MFYCKFKRVADTRYINRLVSTTEYTAIVLANGCVVYKADT